MWIVNLFYRRGLALTTALAACWLIRGCASRQEAPEAAGPAFFPSAPEKTRLQFLTSLSGPADLGAAGPSGFERFVLGEAEEKKGITTPYGLALHDGKLYVCDVGKELRINPIDVVVRGPYCCVTDFASNRVVVLDKATGKEVHRIGEAGDGENQFKLISDLAFGPDGDLYVTDKLKAKIFHFDAAGNLKRTIGRRGVRP